MILYITHGLGVTFGSRCLHASRPLGRLRGFRLQPNPPPSKNQPPTALQVLLSYIQVLSVIRNVPIDFQDNLSRFFDFTRVITSIPGRLLWTI
jgi:hypothetical protein